MKGFIGMIATIVIIALVAIFMFAPSLISSMVGTQVHDCRETPLDSFCICPEGYDKIQTFNIADVFVGWGCNNPTTYHTIYTISDIGGRLMCHGIADTFTEPGHQPTDLPEGYYVTYAECMEAKESMLGTNDCSIQVGDPSIEGSYTATYLEGAYLGCVCPAQGYTWEECINNNIPTYIYQCSNGEWIISDLELKDVYTRNIRWGCPNEFFDGT